MKIPTTILTTLLLLPLTLSAPTPNPTAPCVVKSINGVTTQSGDCGGNQQASASSNNGGGGSGNGTSMGGSNSPSVSSGTESAGGDDGISDAESLIKEIESEIPGFGGGE